MKKLMTLAIALILSAGAFAQNYEAWSSLKKNANFFLASDLGRNGYYDQKPIAELMGIMAEEIGPECIIAAGDIHHFDGVQSVDDPLWMTNYELVYSHPELMIDWLPVLGNHEYRGTRRPLWIIRIRAVVGTCLQDIILKFMKKTALPCVSLWWTPLH